MLIYFLKQSCGWVKILVKKQPILLPCKGTIFVLGKKQSLYFYFVVCTVRIINAHNGLTNLMPSE